MFNSIFDLFFFLQNYQPWVIKTYGDLAKTKTITVKKHQRILKALSGHEQNNPDSSKFRFWVKAKGKPPINLFPNACIQIKSIGNLTGKKNMNT